MAPRFTSAPPARPPPTPPSNTGVCNPLLPSTHPRSGRMTAWRWDWYAATVTDSAHELQAALLALYPGSWAEVASALYGYSDAFTVRDGEGLRARVMHGGRNGWPNVSGSGQDAPATAQLLRERFPLHAVTRCDVAADFDGPDAWERLSGLGFAVADDHKAKVQHAGDWHRGIDGRTLYVGAPTSGVRVRIYEKGKELRAKQVPGAEAIGEDVVRVEVQVRPEGRSRNVAALMTPEAAWGFSRWSRDLVARVDGTDVPRTTIKEPRKSDDDRALEFLVLQYGAVLERQAEKHGGWDRLAAVMRSKHERNLRRKDDR